MSASFGGGIGRMRLTCGAVSGMMILAGLDNGSAVGGDNEQRTKNYELARELAEKFKEVNGSITCAELLGLRAGTVEPPKPDERTADYYKKRPCVEMVKSACEIYANYLKEEGK